MTACGLEHWESVYATCSYPPSLPPSTSFGLRFRAHKRAVRQGSRALRHEIVGSRERVTNQQKHLLTTSAFHGVDVAVSSAVQTNVDQ